MKVRNTSHLSFWCQ